MECSLQFTLNKEAAAPAWDLHLWNKSLWMKIRLAQRYIYFKIIFLSGERPSGSIIAAQKYILKFSAKSWSTVFLTSYSSTRTMAGLKEYVTWNSYPIKILWNSINILLKYSRKLNTCVRTDTKSWFLLQRVCAGLSPWRNSHWYHQHFLINTDGDLHITVS